MEKTNLPEEIEKLFPEGGKELCHYFDEPDGGLTADPRIWSKVNRDEKKTVSKYMGRARDEEVYPHDEPWVTLVGLYGLFGDQRKPGFGQRVGPVNELMFRTFKPTGGPAPEFESMTSIHVEPYLHRNHVFHEKLKKAYSSTPVPYHLYPDVREKIRLKLEGKLRGTFEGNTNLDVLISGKAKEDGRDIHIFGEAKFNSDIAYHISYMPVRNQIARNIDCAMDLMTRIDPAKPLGDRDMGKLADFWFVLVTPGIFRTDAYGGRTRTTIDDFHPERSRLYCYKMDEYRDWRKLKDDLPHWDLSDKQWEGIVQHIGWVTFEDISEVVVGSGFLSGEPLEGFKEFMGARGLAGEP